MKILAFADLHGDKNSFKKIQQKSKAADIILCAGDISRMENNLPALLAELDELNKPILIIHGNHEDKEGLKEITEIHDNLTFFHNAVHHINNHTFIGHGGGGFSYRDHDFEKIAKEFFHHEVKGSHRIIMMTHAPPFGTNLDFIHGEHKGNKSYKEFIDQVRPHLVIAGHLHETAGQVQQIGRTMLINPGKEGMLINI